VAETLIMNRGELLRLSEFTTLSIFTCVHTITMAPYSRWVHPSFRQTLMDACDEYLQSTDRGNDKTRSKLITRVAKDITDIAKEKNEALPDDLEKVILMFLSLS